MGHEGAGTFWNDVWVYDYPSDSWEEIEVESDNMKIEGFGWAAGVSSSERGELFFWGGLDEHNKRIEGGLKIAFL